MNQSLEQLFKSKLPDNLYLDHYALADIYRQHSYTPEEWRIYLRSQERFIMNEIAAITEANARAALSRLSSGQTDSKDVQAIRQLLERSEQINKAAQSTKTFVVTSFDPNPDPDFNKPNAPTIGQIILKNKENARKVYNLDDFEEMNKFHRREQAGEIIYNRDGTYYIPVPKTEADHIYLRLFNPDNVEVHDLPVSDYEKPEMSEVQ